MWVNGASRFAISGQAIEGGIGLYYMEREMARVWNLIKSSILNLRGSFGQILRGIRAFSIDIIEFCCLTHDLRTVNLESNGDSS